MKEDIKSFLLEELEERFISMGLRKFKAGQVFSWLHKGVRTFDEMTDLSLEHRAMLSEAFYITVPQLLEKQVSKIDGTVKYLWGISKLGADTDADDDGSAAYDSIESVLMDYPHGTAICISTQVGCKMGCIFCASTIGGFVRNLSVSEMLDQVLFSTLDSGKRVSNVVLMGIGEPLDNFENTIRFIDLIKHHKGLNIGARHITVSTCGVTQNIDRLADYGIQSMLAISLHAPDDETRTKLMPCNRNTGITALLDSAMRYFNKTGRRITYEYVMINGVNDSPEQAKALSDLLRRTGSHLNLILLSNIQERSLRVSTKERLEAFSHILKQNGVNFTVRRQLGADIDASCGQLRSRRARNDL